ncbi:MAG: 1-deoxy-D-xylulose-5-phosphate reductoisomerase [Bacteroidales bacterium]|jgi:1-deoxy-D-xylulose-5-phosphate reductoisomerase|nr:1-deoxy-D-xylulose-5-phosphate reductoisomerase [Bacteroidales bacterium]
MEQKRNIAILGSTGSIGKQTLQIVEAHRDIFNVEVLVANSNWKLLAEQAIKFEPNCVVIADNAFYTQLKEALQNTDIKVFAGKQSIDDVVQMDSVDTILAAIVGIAGLSSVMAAIKKGKTIALANKETLVVGGSLVISHAMKNGVAILPVDSEHSAIFQCLTGEYSASVKKIYLTASGGPFKGFSQKELAKVSVKEALNHPNWSMGRKVTIDSATLMNKGLEMIEAHWLFGVQPRNIDVVIHRQSIVHSLVEFTDGSFKAQLGLPDMRLPIQYALAFPQRLDSKFESMDLFSLGNLTFEKPDRHTFHCLNLAYQAIEKGGNMPAVLNAANEVAVEAFLNEQISILSIAELIEKAIEKSDYIANPTFDDLIQTDIETRSLMNKIYSI